jgi:hypothetical protein
LSQAFNELSLKKVKVEFRCGNLTVRRKTKYEKKSFNVEIILEESLVFLRNVLKS